MGCLGPGLEVAYDTMNDVLPLTTTQSHVHFNCRAAGKYGEVHEYWRKLTVSAPSPNHRHSSKVSHHKMTVEFVYT